MSVGVVKVVDGKWEYRGYSIEGAVGTSWEFGHHDYDGADTSYDKGSGDHRFGRGTSMADCVSQIDQQYIDEGLDSEGSYQ